MIQLKVQKSPAPTLVELRDAISEMTDKKVVATWNNTREENFILRQHPDKDFLLYVPDMLAMEKAAYHLGLFCVYPHSTVQNTQVVLNAGKSEWKEYVSKVGPGTTRNLLVKLVANAIAMNAKVDNIIKVVDDCLLEGVSTFDVDILLRAKCLK